ncbi:hypothetical protein CHLRE_03g203800v5 [Chlamydomonas reinhardtii]|uniref:Uncharacterized protein n=1 Tax=Chlamydomonas reinhardtii TaxID=3055 RepID=A8IXF2_CHLRE|nr:uncharacterized protein CHLRE_03g203800v5 [Chlamydomonas reinhardtii]PNW85825.1 hypothetical protein CHLRE_03g203800v5 [Chlamydomonas reinhardtii]|eukprot:XP_001693197.1 hypothetical protein CHLREDRAFT_183944 [Chlamydomonas reinhardtii]
MSAAILSRRPLHVKASGAPTPLRAHKRGKLSTSGAGSSSPPSSGSSSAPVVRRPIDLIANQISDPILRAAVQEPVAFWGGVFAGVFRLSLDTDPLKTWVERTSSQARAATGQPAPPPPPGSSRQ